MNVQHPTKVCVPLAIGLAWGNDGALYAEKLDGRFTVRNVPRGVLVGETVHGVFTAFDCVELDGQDLRRRGYGERYAAARELCDVFAFFIVPIFANGGELLRTVLKRGGEGIVRKDPQSTYYDAMTACKRLETWRCRVTGFKSGTQTVQIADADSGESRGAVALRGGKVDRVQIGSIVKIEGLGLHASGLIRDPRPCCDTPDSWLITL